MRFKKGEIMKYVIKIIAIFSLLCLVDSQCKNLTEDLAVLEVNLSQLSKLLLAQPISRGPASAAQVPPAGDEIYYGKIFTDVYDSRLELRRDDDIYRIGQQLTSIDRNKFQVRPSETQENHKMMLNVLYGYKIAEERLRDELLNLSLVSAKSLKENMQHNWNYFVNDHISKLSSQLDREKARNAFAQWSMKPTFLASPTSPTLVPPQVPQVSSMGDGRYFGKIFTDVAEHGSEIRRDDNIDKIGLRLITLTRTNFGADEQRPQNDHKKILNVLYGYKIAERELRNELLKLPFVYEVILKENMEDNWNSFVDAHINLLSDQSDREKAREAFAQLGFKPFSPASTTPLAPVAPYAEPVEELKYYGRIFEDVKRSWLEAVTEYSYDRIAFDIFQVNDKRFGLSQARSQEEHKQLLNALYGYKIAAETLQDELIKTGMLNSQNLKEIMETRWTNYVREHIDQLTDESEKQKAKDAFSQWIQF